MQSRRLLAQHIFAVAAMVVYTDLPNAAISVWPGIVSDKATTVMWNVSWDDPVVKAAGICSQADGDVSGYEQS